MTLALAVATAALGGCSHDDDKQAVPKFLPPGADGEPEGLVVHPPELPPASANTPAPGSPAAGTNGRVVGPTIQTPGGGEIHTIMVDGKPFVPIEVTFSERSWQAIVGQAGFEQKSRAERDVIVKKELANVFTKISAQTKIVGMDLVPSIGWGRAYVARDAYESLQGINGIGRRLLVNPVITTPMKRAERSVAHDRELGFSREATITGSGAFGGLEDLVGIGRMGVDDFITSAAGDLGGYRPDGSHVTIGVVDTGITYNHPAFKDAAGTSRIDSMLDFTGEGRMIFTQADKGRFTVKPATKLPDGVSASLNEALSITADFLVAPADDPTSEPDPNALQAVEDETILVSPELKALLEAPNASGARFSVLDEANFGAGQVDLDHNGKTDDRFYAILIPGDGADKPDAVWLAVGGAKGDFRKSPRMTSFNLAHETQSAYAERFGLDIQRTAIVDPTGAETPVTTAAIVGFDPGNHGSHVAGIAAARKIIANAPDDTKLRGVAPMARLSSGRICANTAGCFGTKAIIALSEAGADVINMSIGSLGPANDGYGVQEAVIDRLTVQNGTAFVVAASNDGPGRQTIGSPSTARYAISVAATATRSMIEKQYQYPGSGKVPSSTGQDEDFLLYFSSRGPTAAGGMKPDIAAPGTWLSAIQLNSAPGAASGLDVMWGTSMASPATAGAVALLLDAARAYNQRHPMEPVATDARTLRRVLLGSGRPFDITTLDLKTNEARRGQYTWVDQGFGMVNLARAWTLLKEEKVARKDAAVHFVQDGATHEVPLDYQVRVLRTNPNGLAYDGSQSIQGAGDTPEAKFGRGLWLDTKLTESLYRVQIARRLPSDVVSRPDVGDLAAQLKTTADEFELETTIHGSHVAWVRAGSKNELDCTSTPPPANGKLPRLLVVGEGAVDVPVDPATGKGGSVAQDSSQLHICVNRGLVDTLPPGDHGAVITAYRVIGQQREAVPSFTVPVYITVPHKTLAGPEGLHVASTVESFGVGRHYVDVPKGMTIVKVSLDIPPAAQTGTAVTGCGGVILEALEGGNTKTPIEFKKQPSDAIAMSCSGQGRVAPDDWRHVSIVRSAPTTGIWDLHVFGMYQFKSTPYTLNVEFAKVTTSKVQIDGPPSALSDTINVDVADASYALALSPTLSTFALAGYSRDQSAQIAAGQKLRVPNATGSIARSYAADVAAVTISTGLSTGNDLDLEILECDDAAAANCVSAKKSAGPTDAETATFNPKPGKFYVAEVEGFAIADAGGFVLREMMALANAEKGTLAMTQPSPKRFAFATSYPTETSTVLFDARFASGNYVAEGFIDIKDDGGALISRIPVHVRHP